MNTNRRAPAFDRPQRQSALERISEFLKQNDEARCEERRRLLHKVLFGDSEDPNKPGQTKLSEATTNGH